MKLARVTGYPITLGDPTVALNELRFGLFLSQASRSWAEVLADFVLAEDLGFDHAWLVDHLVDTDGPPDDGLPRGVDAAGRDRGARPSGSGSASS